MTQDFYYIALIITLIFAIIAFILMGSMIKIYFNVIHNFNKIERKIDKNDK